MIVILTCLLLKRADNLRLEWGIKDMRLPFSLFVTVSPTPSLCLPSSRPEYRNRSPFGRRVSPERGMRVSVIPRISTLYWSRTDVSWWYLGTFDKKKCARRITVTIFKNSGRPTSIRRSSNNKDQGSRGIVILLPHTCCRFITIHSVDRLGNALYPNKYRGVTLPSQMETHYLSNVKHQQLHSNVFI